VDKSIVSKSISILSSIKFLEVFITFIYIQVDEEKIKQTHEPNTINPFRCAPGNHGMASNKQPGADSACYAKLYADRCGDCSISCYFPSYRNNACSSYQI
jgi:hypothetical protein